MGNIRQGTAAADVSGEVSQRIRMPWQLAHAVGIGLWLAGLVYGMRYLPLLLAIFLACVPLPLAQHLVLRHLSGGDRRLALWLPVSFVGLLLGTLVGMAIGFILGYAGLAWSFVPSEAGASSLLGMSLVLLAVPVAGGLGGFILSQFQAMILRRSGFKPAGWVATHTFVGMVGPMIFFLCLLLVRQVLLGFLVAGLVLGAQTASKLTWLETVDAVQDAMV